MDNSVLPPDTPVLVGVGQSVERLSADDYQGLSAVDVAAQAVRAALADSGCADALAKRVDLVSTTRTFNDSAPHLKGPFGASDNFPRSIAGRVGIDPKKAIWEDSGGNTPQRLVSEACELIAAGEFGCALIAGAENISTMRRLVSEGASVDWSETVPGQVEDRHGQQMVGVLSKHAFAHGLLHAPPLYGLCENARRGAARVKRDQWRQTMAQWFAPFTRVAAENPYSSAETRAYSAEELASVTVSNRLIADPYPRLMVARDQVNQGAAVIVTNLATVRELGIDEQRCVFLHGYAAAKEKMLEHRPDIGAYPAGVAAVRAALDSAGVGIDDVAVFDFYSCFPIAVSSIAEPFGLTSDDPRGLTVTGGLPFFGGPGNNYSMHAIASMVERLREKPGSMGLVGANGGFLSKYAVGVYSTTPREFQACDSTDLQRQLDEVPSPEFTEVPHGPGRIETYTIIYARDGTPEQAIVVGRLHNDGVRFLANTEEGDNETLERMVREEPLNALITVRSTERGNRFKLEQ